MANFYFFRYRWFNYSLAVFIHLILTQPSASQPAVNFVPVISGLSSPVDIVNAGDGTNRIFIAQQGGTIRVYNSSYGLIGDFLTVTGIVTGGEQGLLSIAFHPDYETNGFFWVYYTNAAGDLELARYQVSANPNIANASSKQVVLTIPHPVNSNHNGGKLNFGSDGYLYFATGDGGGSGDPANNAQNGNVLLGKMLRINVTVSPNPPFYTIPPGNPFINDSNISDEIWALGLRNPFRWSFDRLTNDMWIGDVGQNAREEINYSAEGTSGGVNYGWRCYEGNLPFNTSGCGPAGNYVFPVYDYPNPAQGAASVIGGIVYRGSAYPAMQGYYFAADVYSGNVYVVNPNAGFSTTVQTGLPNLVAGFGETENGEMLTVSLNGSAYNVTTNAVLPVDLVQFSASIRNGVVTLNWQTAAEQDIRHFEIEFGTDGRIFNKVGIVTGKNDPRGASYEFDHILTSLVEQVYYRLKMVDLNGSFSYSDIVNVKPVTKNKSFVYPTLVDDGIIKIFIQDVFTSVRLINSNGSVINRMNISGRTGKIEMPVQGLSPGMYIVQLSGDNSIISQKVIIRK
jgi:glucose/arabinose dehydrogenase